MKYYSEAEDHDLRQAFETEIRTWPNVRTRKMFGCPCYQANGKLFALVVSGGIVITRLSDADRALLIHQNVGVPFQPGQKTVQSWLQIAVQNKAELKPFLPYVRKSYDAALAQDAQ
jgi:TfoX/Sxy family transcriptional regulator of competence genes